jgi:hypothetical protein
MSAPRFGFLPWLSKVKWTDGRLLLACLGFGFAIRLVPELLAWPLPIGFDTVHYAVVMKSGVIWEHWSQFFTSTWLLYGLIVPSYNVIQGDTFLLLKVAGPLLFGLNVAGVFWFARKALSWSLALSVFAGVFFSLQLASLRIGWDLLRNSLGLGILLFALSYVEEVGSKRGLILFALLSLLSVFAHEYSTVILMFLVLSFGLWKLFKRRTDEVKRLFLGISPALAVSFARVYLTFHPIQYEVPSNVFVAGEATEGRIGLFLVDYLRIQNSVDSHSSYASLALSVGLLFAVLFLPYLFLIAQGFFRKEVLNSWTGLLLIGAFGCLVIPVLALQHWHRWMFMLVYPFSFYAVYGISKTAGLLDKAGKWRISFSGLVSRKKVLVIIMLTFGLGVSYLFTPFMVTYAGIGAPYIADISTYFSVSPSVPFNDVKDVIESIEWLNVNMNSSCGLVLHYVFLNWGKLCLYESHQIVYSENSPEEAVNAALNNGLSQLYFLWWNEPIGWYGYSVPDEFVIAESFGRISVFVYDS